MQYFYYAENDQQLGPFTIEELKVKRLKKSTLVWAEGMKEWKSAGDIEELISILISLPPPLPKKDRIHPTAEAIQIKQTLSTVTSSEYDLADDTQIEATIFGVLLLVVPILLKLSGVISFENEEDYNMARVAFGIGSLISRIAFTIWVVDIASRQNRNSTVWGWFTFFLPSVALIIIGQLKTLRLKTQLEDSLPKNQKVTILLEKANQQYLNDRYSGCIEILNKAIEIDKQSFECIRLRGLANYKIKSYSEAKSDFEILIKNEKFPSMANYYLGNLAIKNKDRELAVRYFQNANEHNNKNAKLKLDLYHTYTGNYLLDKSNIAKKLTLNNAHFFADGKYSGGLVDIDSIEKLANLDTSIVGYENGVEIELSKTFKSYHICVAYYEIDNIVFKESEKSFELELTDKNVLKFCYDPKKDYKAGLKNVCEKFKKATGKTPLAEAALLELNRK